MSYIRSDATRFIAALDNRDPNEFEFAGVNASGGICACGLLSRPLFKLRHNQHEIECGICCARRWRADVNEKLLNAFSEAFEARRHPALHSLITM